ncbi:MAG: carbamoyltransferase [bacterium]|nr:carbamoyltransferase [bacterium]
MRILGISAFYHDAAACLVDSGDIVAAAQEERFTRKKHDASFPTQAIQYCLEEAGLKLTDLDDIVFYDKPWVKFERLLSTYLSYAPRGLRSFLAAMPVWLKEKLFIKTLLKRELAEIGGIKGKDLPPLLFSEHHQSHAASAFYPSPFDSAVVLCLDGVGEWATTTAWVGRGNQLKPLWEIDFPHSLGLLYSAFTYYTGFKVNSGEYKVMGLAPYGEPKYAQTILDELIEVRPDGTFKLNMDYFNFAQGLTMTSEKFHRLLGGPPRPKESPLRQRDMDLAASIQVVTEEVVSRLAETLARETGKENLCLAGGVALNCVANGKILRRGIFKDLWIQPAAGDAGGALGAALATWHHYRGHARRVNGGDTMKGAYLGPRFDNAQIEAALKAQAAVFQKYPEEKLLEKVSGLLASGKVVGWFQGRMEFGPRALGSRSILGDPRNPKMQSVMNLKIKYRESFRPFAPAVLEEKAREYFNLDHPSPYMLLVAPVQESQRRSLTEEENKLFGIDKLKTLRSSIPAVTHVDYTARVQTVGSQHNPRFHHLLQKFFQDTACPILINTSFNVRGEPIVCHPEDAYRCFMRTEMDALVLEDCLLLKEEQKALPEDKEWQREFELD